MEIKVIKKQEIIHFQCFFAMMSNFLVISEFSLQTKKVEKIKKLLILSPNKFGKTRLKTSHILI